jgi:Sec-independent protein translocase protein TatA
MPKRTPSTRNPLKYDREYYTPAAIAGEYSMTRVAARAEYSRLRKIAQDRLRRIGRDALYSQFEIYQRNKTRFKAPSKVTEKELPGLLSEVAAFLSSSRSTLSGLKAERESVINKIGYRYGVDLRVDDEYLMFTKFMEEYRSKKLDKLYSSERALAYFREHDVRSVKNAIREFRRAMRRGDTPKTLSELSAEERAKLRAPFRPDEIE